MSDKRYYTGQSILTPVSESAEQTAFFRWAAYMEGQHPELSLLYHIPNGGLRNKAVAGKLKSEGVKSGVPDIHLPVARAGYHSLFIEMKALKGRCSDVQKQWITRLNEQGHLAVVCYSCEEAMKIVVNYLDAEGGKLNETEKYSKSM